MQATVPHQLYMEVLPGSKGMTILQNAVGVPFTGTFYVIPWTSKDTTCLPGALKSPCVQVQESGATVGRMQHLAFAELNFKHQIDFFKTV
jgi:hypothetical protein